MSDKTTRFEIYLDRHSNTARADTDSAPQQPDESSVLPASQSTSEGEPQKFTLEEAYEYHQGDDGTLDLEKAVRAVGYLLEWGTDIGNRDLDGVAATGLASILRRCVKEIGWQRGGS